MIYLDLNGERPIFTCSSVLYIDLMHLHMCKCWLSPCSSMAALMLSASFSLGRLGVSFYWFSDDTSLDDEHNRSQSCILFKQGLHTLRQCMRVMLRMYDRGCQRTFKSFSFSFSFNVPTEKKQQFHYQDTSCAKLNREVGQADKMVNNYYTWSGCWVPFTLVQPTTRRYFVIFYQLLVNNLLLSSE